ncbi:MAG: non-homologous end-joining DNA ligase [Candidatus Fermentithermobacillus carboniphilus]|uniref:Non-homologous end-joining DNA ligase n=1 Tax=Candidatus Fermentithermobacillus carboniphilus TaxID=3085328 RepID=A0AAT9LCS8_9FIRM|nr:MAG: non-homologous end-joining DNA ligase [Candidatus Fermentithermobacillus carboniphilus]
MPVKQEKRIRVRIGAREIEVSNLDKVYWPEDGFTKADLLEYYVTIARWILPHLKDRPLSLVRFPEGIQEGGFYQKDAPPGTPEWVRIAPVMSKEKGTFINFILCDNVETLAWMANSGVIEINPWLSRYGSLDYPDFAVFDIDPAEGAGWEDVKVVVRMVQSLLSEWKLEGFPKVSGATGVHIYVPVEPRYTYKEISMFVKYAATIIEAAYPEKVTLKRKVKERHGHVYIDYPQNARGQTISSVYGVKALSGAPVSMPVTWDEIDRVLPNSWNIKTAPERLELAGDMFARVLTSRQNIDPFLRAALSGKAK